MAEWSAKQFIKEAEEVGVLSPLTDDGHKPVTKAESGPEWFTVEKCPIEKWMRDKRPYQEGGNRDFFITALLGYHAYGRELSDPESGNVLGYLYELKRESDGNVLISHYCTEPQTHAWVWTNLCPRMATSYMGIESIMEFAAARWGFIQLVAEDYHDGKGVSVFVRIQDGNGINLEFNKGSLKEKVFQAVQAAWNAECEGKFLAKK